MKEINAGQVLVIPDVHQNLTFVKAILDREDQWDHLVFLGDYMDTHKTVDNITIYNVRETVEYFNQLYKELGDRVTFLMGNHDLSYLSTLTNSGIPPRGSPYTCSGWSRNKAKYFNRYVDRDWVNSWELCIRLGDWVCVHAGFVYPHFTPMMSEWDNIAHLHRSWERDKQAFGVYNPHGMGGHWIGHVSANRGGNDRCSSPVWLDWSELHPIDNVRRLVGHTSFPEFPKWRGKDICLDGAQQYYGVWFNNDVVVKEAYTGKVAEPTEYKLERDESIRQEA